MNRSHYRSGSRDIRGQPPVVFHVGRLSFTGEHNSWIDEIQRADIAFPVKIMATHPGNFVTAHAGTIQDVLRELMVVSGPAWATDRCQWAADSRSTRQLNTA